MARQRHERLSSPRVTLIAMLVFVLLVGFLAFILQRSIVSFFFTNPGLNGLILGVLGVGVVLAFMQVIRLFREIAWVNAFRARDGDEPVDAGDPVLLAPMKELLTRADKSVLDTQATQSILDSVGNRLDERRETARYLIGLLVFLGLLGTFWGLLGTIGSIGNTIQSLDPASGTTSDVLDSLKTGLSAPLEGMGTAFSSSLFGLAGSLILGFLDLQAGQAQNRFYLEVENWLSSVTSVSADTLVRPGDDVRVALEKLSRALSDGAGGQRSTAAMASLAEGVQSLVRHMRSEQQMIRDWVEAQSSAQDDIRRLLVSVERNLAGGPAGGPTGGSGHGPAGGPQPRPPAVPPAPAPAPAPIGEDR